MNYYDVLKVDKDASAQEIKASYKKLIKRYHPDLYPGNKTKAEAITRNLNEAYDVLSDPDKRALYDLSIDEPISETKTYDYTPPKQQHYYYQSTTYNTHNNNKNTYQEKSAPTWDDRLREKMYDSFDKKTQNLSQESKRNTVLILILIAFVALLITAGDLLSFKNSIAEKERIERERIEQEKLEEYLNTTQYNQYQNYLTEEELYKYYNYYLNTIDN